MAALLHVGVQVHVGRVKHLHAVPGAAHVRILPVAPLRRFVFQEHVAPNMNVLHPPPPFVVDDGSEDAVAGLDDLVELLELEGHAQPCVVGAAWQARQGRPNLQRAETDKMDGLQRLGSA